MKRLIFILAALFATAQSQTIQTIGAPTTTVVSRGNFRTDSIFYLPKRQKLPTDSGAVRYQISDSSVYYWTGSNWRRLGVHIDTASMLNPYLRGSGTANYLPIFDATRSVINSKVYQSGTNLLFNTTTASFTSTGISTIEANNTSASVFALKVLDTTRSYIASNSSNTMDINNLRAGDIRFYTSATLRGRFQTDGTFRLNSLTGTGSRIVTADADGVLSATSSATGLVDTTVLSTRAWRQKGDDSLGAIIATKGSGTVTSVATGYGLSGGTITTTGTIIADTALLATRLRVGKVVDSLALVKQNVLTNPVTGTGTTNYVPKFTGTSTIGNSQIFDNGSFVGVNTSSPIAKLSVQHTAADIFAISNTTTTGSTNHSSLRIASYDGSAVTVGTYLAEIASSWTSGNFYGGNYPNSTSLLSEKSGGLSLVAGHASGVLRFYSGGQTTASERGRFNAAGELLLNTTTDAGDYKLQVSGNAYVTGTTVLAATSGNVGVGTASPTADGTIDVVSSSNNYMRIRSSTALRAYMYFQNSLTGTTISDGMNIGVNDAGNMFINNRESSDLYIGTSNATRMTVTAAGEILINTVSDAGDYKLQVSGNVAISGTYTSAAPTDGTAAPWRLGSYVTTAPTATGFVQVEINGVKYKLLAATY
jgi:hypothetical protein